MPSSPQQSRLPVRNGTPLSSPRSASDPFASYTPSEPALAPAQTAPPPARKETTSAMPSIRSLRNAFSNLGSGSWKAKQQGPKVVTGEAAAATARGVAPSSPPTAQGDGGGSIGKSGGSRFGFGGHRKVDPSPPPPEPRFQAFVQRPSVDASFPQHSSPNLISTSPKAARPLSPLPPIPVEPPSPDLAQLPPTLPLSPSATSSNPKLRHRISADFARSPDDAPLAKLREGDARSLSLSRRSKRASHRISAPVYGRPSQEDKRGRHVSAGANLFSSSKVAGLKDDFAFRRHSIASSPVLAGGSPEMAKDKGAGWQKVVEGGGWEKAQSAASAAGVGLGVTSSTGPSLPTAAPSSAPETGRKQSTPFPSDFEPVPIQHLKHLKPSPRPLSAAVDGLRILKPISIPATPDRHSIASYQKRFSSAGSRRDSQDTTGSRSPSVRSSSPAIIAPAQAQAVGRISSLQRPESNRSSMGGAVASRRPSEEVDEEVLEITAAAKDKPSLMGQAQEEEQARSRSALDSAREHGDTTGYVASERSPVFVIPTGAFADAAGEMEWRSSSNSLRKSAVDDGNAVVREREWKEKKERRRSLRGERETQSEQWGDHLSRMLAGQSSGPPNVGGLATTTRAPVQEGLFARASPPAKLNLEHKGTPSRVEGPTSPLDDLISELGGRRPSDVSSLGGGRSSLYSFAGNRSPSDSSQPPRPHHSSAVDASASPPLVAAAETFSYPSPLRNRPPSAPPTMDLPVTPIGMPDPEFSRAAAASRSPSKEEEPFSDSEEDSTAVIQPGQHDADRTLTLDQMEREIQRMEAELALGGRRLEKTKDSPLPLSFSPTPSQTESMMATPRMDDSHFAPPSPVVPPPAVEESTSPLPSTAPTLERNPSQSSSVNDITPRTARKWSIVEVERAYQRMRGMLGSTKSFCLTDDGEAGDDVTVEEAFEQVVKRSGEGVTLADVEDDVVLLLTPNRISTPAPGSERSISPSPARASFEPNLKRSQGSPSLAIDASAANSQALTRASVDLLNGSRAPTSPAYSSSIVSLKPSVDSLKPPSSASARAMRRRTFDAAPSSDSLREVFDSSGDDLAATKAHRRESDSVSSRRAHRISNRSAAPSAISEVGTSDDGWATPADSPAQADRFGPRSPAAAARASSRLSNSGALRSGAGKELQKWLADDDRPASLASSSRAASRLSVQRLFSPVPAEEGTETETTPKRSSLRPLVLATHAGIPESNGWFPSTPDRQVHRKRSSLGRSTLSTTTTDSGSGARRSSSNESEASGNGEMNIATIRSMDKLEIFFKYTSVKADLEKAVVERDALQDALQETRTTLTDVRAQRDGLEADLKESREAFKQLRKYLGNDSDAYAEKLNELVRGRQLWEDRARDAFEELERSRDEAEALRRELVEGREREEQLERETVMMGARLAAGEAYRASPSPHLASTVATAASSSPRSTRYHPSPRHDSPKLNGNYRTSGIPPPRRTGSAPASPNLARNGSKLPQPASPVTPASKLASAYRARTDSNASSGSSIDRMDQQHGLGVGETPLMGQTMAFGPKSSFGSIASPLKARSSPATPASSNGGSPFGATTKITPPSARGQFNRLRLPVPPSAAERNRLSRMSTASSDFGGDHLPPPVERDWNPTATDVVPELREDDERFLRDLSSRDSYSDRSES